MGGRVNSTINLPRGVMFNAYPDSLGQNLSSIVTLLQRPELENVFSLFYILPTFFNSDLDRGFSIIDYELNTELVSQDDLDRLDKLGIGLKFDLVLNHLSVGSPQFQNLLEDGDSSPFKDFFIDWNEFWAGEGEMGEDGHIVPKPAHLEKLFLRKPGLPLFSQSQIGEQPGLDDVPRHQPRRCGRRLHHRRRRRGCRAGGPASCSRGWR